MTGGGDVQLNLSTLPATKVTERINQSADNSVAPLKRWPEVRWQDANTIGGYAGLSTEKTKHGFQVENNSLYTWCACYALFIPAHLQKDVCIESHCPQSQTLVSLKIRAYTVLEQSMEQIYLFLIKPGPRFDLKNIESKFCYHIYFFAGLDAAKRWQTKIISATYEITTSTRSPCPNECFHGSYAGGLPWSSGHSTPRHREVICKSEGTSQTVKSVRWKNRPFLLS
jgi:Alkylmercury lyase